MLLEVATLALFQHKEDPMSWAYAWVCVMRVNQLAVLVASYGLVIAGVVSLYVLNATHLHALVGENMLSILLVSSVAWACFALSACWVPVCRVLRTASANACCVSATFALWVYALPPVLPLEAYLLLMLTSSLAVVWFGMSSVGRLAQQDGYNTFAAQVLYTAQLLSMTVLMSWGLHRSLL